MDLEFQKRKKDNERLNQLRKISKKIDDAKLEGNTQILVQPLYEKNIIELQDRGCIINQLFLQKNDSCGIEIANLIQWSTKCEEEEDTLKRNNLPQKIVLDEAGFNAFWALHQGGFM